MQRRQFSFSDGTIFLITIPLQVSRTKTLPHSINAFSFIFLINTWHPLGYSGAMLSPATFIPNSAPLIGERMCSQSSLLTDIKKSLRLPPWAEIGSKGIKTMSLDCVSDSSFIPFLNIGVSPVRSLSLIHI